MSRDHIRPDDVPEDVAFSLRAIREALDRIADALEALRKDRAEELADERFRRANLDG